MNVGYSLMKLESEDKGARLRFPPSPLCHCGHRLLDHQKDFISDATFTVQWLENKIENGYKLH
jgi:hypothetical protein